MTKFVHADGGYFEKLARPRSPHPETYGVTLVFLSSSCACIDFVSILTHFTHCCSVRHTTYQRLQLLQKGVLSRVMKAVLSADPLRPVLTDKHLNALDRRLQHVIYEIHKCVKTHGSKNVFSL